MDEFYETLDRLMREGDMARIEAYILTVARSREGTDGELANLAAIYNELGSFYRGVSRYEESAESFHKSLQAFSAAGMERSLQYATVMLNLAGLLRLMGKPQDAIQLFLETQKLMVEASLDDMYLYITILNNLSLVYIQTKQYDRALELCSEAMVRIEKNSEADEHEVATTLNNLASAYLGKGDLDAAGAAVGKALELYDAMPYANVHHAAALVTYGSICYKKGMLSDAIEAFERSLPLTKRFFGINAEYIATCFNLHLAYAAAGYAAESEAYLSEAYSRAQNLLGESHPYTMHFKKAIEAKA